MAFRAALEEYMRYKTLLTATVAALSTSIMAGLSAAHAETPILTIYTYESFAAEWGPGPAIKKAFEAECACDVNFVALDSSCLLYTSPSPRD